MLPDWFDEPTTKPIDQQTREAYEDYKEHFDYNEGDPMDYEEFEEYWWRY